MYAMASRYHTQINIISCTILIYDTEAINKMTDGQETVS